MASFPSFFPCGLAYNFLRLIMCSWSGNNCFKATLKDEKSSEVTRGKFHEQHMNQKTCIDSDYTQCSRVFNLMVHHGVKSYFPMLLKREVHTVLLSGQEVSAGKRSESRGCWQREDKIWAPETSGWWPYLGPGTGEPGCVCIRSS